MPSQSLPESIVGNRVTLRRARLSDIDEITSAVRESLNELKPWLPWAHDGYCIDDAVQYVQDRTPMWDDHTECIFVIRDQEERFLGTCGLNELNSTRLSANLGYWLRTSATGNGYATEATKLLASFGIEHLNLVRVEIVVDVDNHKSQQVATRSGANREGVLANRIVTEASARPAVMYSITPA